MTEHTFGNSTIDFFTSSLELAVEYSGPLDDPWKGSPFEWIMRVPSRTKGAIGEKLVARWAEAQGFDVRKSSSSDADRIINGHRIEIKLSTLWGNGGFKFQQIRDQEYDYCFCVALMPHDVHAWFIPKDALHEYVIGHTPQHTGAGGADTFWLGFQADDPPVWLKEHGGTLDAASEKLVKAGRGDY